MRFLLLLIVFLGGIFPILCSASKVVKDDQKKIYVDDQIRFATGLCDRMYYDPAIDEYKRLIKKFPDDPITAEAYLRMAETYALKKDFSNANKIFNAFFKKFPNIRIKNSARLRYALVLYKSSDPESIKKAVNILNELKKSDDLSEIVKDAAIFHLGSILKEQGNMQGAEKEFSLIAFKKANSEQDKYKALAAMELADLKPLKTAVKLLKPLSESLSLPNYILSAATWKLAALYQKDKNYSKASELFGRCAIIATDKETSIQATYKRLECIFLMNDYSKLITEIDKQLKENNTLSKLMQERMKYLKAIALRGNKFYKPALTELNAIFSSTVDMDLKEKSLYAIVETLILLKKQHTAVKLLEKLINSDSISSNMLAEPLLYIINDSNNNIEYLGMLNALLNKDDLTENKRSLLTLKKSDLLVEMGKLNDAEKLLTDLKGIKNKELTPFMLFKQADLLVKLNKKKLALEKYTILCKNFSNSDLYTQALLQRGILLLDDKKTLSDAMKDFKTVFEKFKDSPEGQSALFYIAYIYFVQNKYEQSKKLYDHLLKSKISNQLKLNTQLYLSWVFLKKKEFNKAIMIVKKNIKILDNAPDAYLLEVADASKDSELDIAEKALQLVLNHSNPDVVQFAYLKLAEIQEKKGNYKLAIESLKNVMKNNKQAALTEKARYNIGHILTLQKKNEEAVLVFEKCLENPVDKDIAAKARLGLAKLLAQDDDRLKTANRYAMAVFILSDNSKIASDAMILSIKILIKLKRKQDALSTFKELSSRFPDLVKTPEVLKLKADIEKL